MQATDEVPCQFWDVLINDAGGVGAGWLDKTSKGGFGVRQQLLGERAEDIAQIVDSVDEPKLASGTIEPGTIGWRAGHA